MDEEYIEEINSERVELLENFYAQYIIQETFSPESLGLLAAREALEESEPDSLDHLPEFAREYDLDNLTEFDMELLVHIRDLEKRLEEVEKSCTTTEKVNP